MQLSKEQRVTILELCKQLGEVSSSKVKENLGFKKSNQALSILRKLTKEGYLEEFKRGRNCFFKLHNEEEVKEASTSHSEPLTKQVTPFEHGGIIQKKEKTEMINTDYLLKQIKNLFQELLPGKRAFEQKNTNFYYSFYNFAVQCNHYFNQNMSYGQRVPFDNLFSHFDRNKIDENIFKLHIRDISLIFPDFIRLNPLSPYNNRSKIIIEIKGTKYDSIVVKRGFI